MTKRRICRNLDRGSHSCTLSGTRSSIRCCHRPKAATLLVQRKAPSQSFSGSSSMVCGVPGACFCPPCASAMLTPPISAAHVQSRSSRRRLRPSGSTGASRSSKRRCRASARATCPCCSRRTLCARGSTTSRTATGTSTRRPGRWYVRTQRISAIISDSDACGGNSFGI